LLLALLFFAFAWIDASREPGFPVQNLVMLGAYAFFAAAVAAIAWNDWWMEAHLAGPAHAVDIALFAVLVYLTNGDNNPFATFSIFIFLSAAIRWGWRATSLTAILLTLLYLLAGGYQPASGVHFHFSDFVAGAGQLIVLSLILIWFGINQRSDSIRGSADELLADKTIEGGRALENGLQAAMAVARARRAVVVWSRSPARRATALVDNGESVSESELEAAWVAPPAPAPFLYDLKRNRALTRDAQRNLRAFAPGDHIRSETANALGLTQGLAVPIRGDRGQGQIFVEQVRGLSTDHFAIGDEISRAVAMHIQRRALMKAAEETAEGRSRLGIARDLHDSVVQFLAGAAFRLEAMKRSLGSGREITPELNELKELMLLEQGELRSFITALRSGSQMELAELARDLQSLATRLSRQWDVQCTFSAEPNEMMVPTRLHFDAQQLVREAIANAVRHAGAKNVSIRVGSETDEVTLDFVNDGTPYPEGPGKNRMPTSLRERVEAAGGRVDLSRGMGVTRISIVLPIAGKAA
jgi:signal transduction histidine kinase